MNAKWYLDFDTTQLPVEISVLLWLC